MEPITTPTVRLVASTAVHDELFDLMLPLADEDGGYYPVEDADLLAEFGGRGCYDAYDRPRATTRFNDDYLDNIIELGHTSVLAHASASFHISGISRSLAQELIRSRFLAFSEISQRYVDVNTLGYVCPPDADMDERAALFNSNLAARAAYNKAVEGYEARGFTRKRARSAARAHLPLSTETRMLVSGNMRAWRDFLWQRLNPAADEEIRQLAFAILSALQTIAPNTFNDIAKEYS